MPITNIGEQLLRDEGLKLRPYRDSVGKLTIGIGRNLDDDGIREVEAYFMRDNDVAAVTTGIRAALPWTASLDPVRFGVLQNMAFNMGLQGLLKFEQFLGSLQSGNLKMAQLNLLHSRWAQQVEDRAKRLIEQVGSGEWQ